VPDSEANILFTAESAQGPKPVVKAATLEKLVQRLTWEAYPGTVFFFVALQWLHADGDVSVCVRLTPCGDGMFMSDPSFMNSFLLTYRSFTTSVELLQMLVLRYNVPLPTHATPVELEQFIKSHQDPIRLR